MSLTWYLKKYCELIHGTKKTEEFCSPNFLFVELSPGSIRTIAIRCMSRQQRCWADGLADRVGSGDATALVAELMAAV